MVLSTNLITFSSEIEELSSAQLQCSQLLRSFCEEVTNPIGLTGFVVGGALAPFARLKSFELLSKCFGIGKVSQGSSLAIACAVEGYSFSLTPKILRGESFNTSGSEIAHSIATIGVLKGVCFLIPGSPVLMQLAQSSSLVGVNRVFAYFGLTENVSQGFFVDLVCAQVTTTQNLISGKLIHSTLPITAHLNAVCELQYKTASRRDSSWKIFEGSRELAVEGGLKVRAREIDPLQEARDLYSFTVKDEPGRVVEVEVEGLLMEVVRPANSPALNDSQGRYSRDIQNCLYAVRQEERLNPRGRDLARALYNLARAYDEVRDFQEAKNALLRALEITPHPMSECELGRIYRELGDLESSELYLQKAIDNPIITPYRARFFYQLGITLSLRKSLLRAEAALREAIRLENGAYSASFYNLGIVLRGLPGRLKEATHQFQSAIRIDPSRHTYFHNLAICLRLQEKPREAIKALKRGIEVLEKSGLHDMKAIKAQYEQELGVLYDKLGATDKAVACLTASVDAFRELSIISPHSMMHLMKIFLKQKMFKEALDLISSLSAELKKQERKPTVLFTQLLVIDSSFEGGLINIDEALGLEDLPVHLKENLTALRVQLAEDEHFKIVRMTIRRQRQA